VALASCSSSTGSGLALLGTAQAGTIKVQLYTATQLATGLSPLYAKLTDASGAGITTAVVTFAPTMTMTGGGTHTAPVVGPVTLNNEYLFQGYILFPMASGAMGSWSMQVGVQIAPALGPTYANFPSLPVANTGAAASFASGGLEYVLGFNLKAVATVGQNPVVVTLFSTSDAGATYVAVDDAAKIINPMVAEGQIHGGVVQGIGQALLEDVVNDENGQPMTTTLADYLILAVLRESGGLAVTVTDEELMAAQREMAEAQGILKETGQPPVVPALRKGAVPGEIR
jgi:hypothetical protein